MKVLLQILLLTLVVLEAAFCASKSPPPRGVAPEEEPFYRPSKTFSCRDNSKRIPYSFVNDDFCDCVDGSDEPGTSACPNGKFFCLNIGYESCTLPSSRVNDGICDCCDGSDEAESICPNTCQELGRERQQKVAEEIEMNRQGAKAKEQLVRSNVEQLNVLREKRTTLEEKKERLRVVVEQLETAIEERREDQVGTVEENNDGEASESSEDDEVDNDDELQDRLEAESIEQEEEDAFAEFDEEMELYDDSDYEREDFDALYPDDEEFHVKESAVHKTKSQYLEPAHRIDDDDEEGREMLKRGVHRKGNARGWTASLIDVVESFWYGGDADLNYFRGNFTELSLAELEEELDECKQKMNDLEDELEEVVAILEEDYGPDNEFYHYRGKCFEEHVEKYNYKLCMFEKVTQDSTDLGRWDSFEDDYTTMKFSNGLSCWQGPRRSTTVLLRCGIEDKIVSVEEPSKCEYEMVFQTPMACSAEHAKELEQAL